MHPLTVTNANRQQLEDEGYFITPVLFTADDLRPLRQTFDELVTSHSHTIKGGTFSSGLHHRYPTCLAFTRHPAFQGLCQQLLGPTAYQTWNQMIYKAPRTAGAFGWHQDAQYGTYNHDGSPNVESPDSDFLTGVITFWVAVTDTTIANGTLWVLPRHHRQGLLPHIWDKDAAHWQGTYDTSNAVAAELKAGQVLAFTRLTPHASGPNTTDAPRIAYQVGYQIGPGIRDQLPFLKNGQLVPAT